MRYDVFSENLAVWCHCLSNDCFRTVKPYRPTILGFVRACMLDAHTDVHQRTVIAGMIHFRRRASIKPEKFTDPLWRRLYELVSERLRHRQPTDDLVDQFEGDDRRHVASVVGMSKNDMVGANVSKFADVLRSSSVNFYDALDVLLKFVDAEDIQAYINAMEDREPLPF